MAVWINDKIIPASRAFPLMISITVIVADMHDVPLVIKELIKPSFLRLTKKRIVIKIKKKHERIKRNLAKAFINISFSLYLKKILESSISEIGIRIPPMK